jgi:hypothetical protein
MIIGGHQFPFGHADPAATAPGSDTHSEEKLEVVTHCDLSRIVISQRIAIPIQVVQSSTFSLRSGLPFTIYRSRYLLFTIYDLPFRCPRHQLALESRLQTHNLKLRNAAKEIHHEKISFHWIAFVFRCLTRNTSLSKCPTRTRPSHDLYVRG